MSDERTLSLRKFVEANRGGLTDLAIELIRCRPSYTEGLQGIVKAQELVASELGTLGMSAELQTPDERIIQSDAFVDASEIVPSSTPAEQITHPFVAGRWDVGARQTLALNGHIDVEPVDDAAWSSPARVRGAVEDDWLFGRGASDMLAAVAAYVFALRAVRHVGEPSLNVEVHTVSSEELGGNGTLGLLDARVAPDLVIIGEPTENELRASTLGFHHFSLRIYGASAHMAEVALGESAIERIPHVLAAVEQLRVKVKRLIQRSPGFSAYSSNPVAIGMINGGRVPAVPPRVCTLEGTVYSPPGLSGGAMGDMLNDAFSAEPGVEVALRRMSFPGNAPAVSSDLERALNARRSSSVEGFASPCDLRHYTNRGVRGVVFGPGDIRFAHAADERVSVSKLIEYTTTLADALLNYTAPDQNQD